MFPDYDYGDDLPKKRRQKFKNYEIAGFVWHQGYNDGIKDVWASEYESNLAKHNAQQEQTKRRT